MGIVHHANYLRFFERARIVWLEEHDQPYTDYMAIDLHFATTRATTDYVLSARFDDPLEITTWVEWIRGASLCMAYRVERQGELLATGVTEHAAVCGDGRVRRIPKENRERIRSRMG